ncbi:NmrA family NAD(P)-binding protein, partial [Achromobacter sp. Marseille-Q0513]|uniref:NmrA family NAD(P)-binding protein n=1 Tax=Achromobacter sp. Marseille-Q0513 TaxID=2829161 RepID=UPI001B99075B
ADLFDLADQIALTVAHAAVAARVPKLIALSSVGADLASGSGWIRMNRMLEQRLLASGIPATFVRAAYFMENWMPMIGQAVGSGTLRSFVSPGERRIAMVAAQDVGRAAAEFLLQDWAGARAITVSGPRSYSPQDVVAALAAELGKPVRLDVLPQAGWPEAQAQAGFSAAALEGFIEMTHGLNAGHIEMDTDPEAGQWEGATTLAQAVGAMARTAREAAA